MNYKYNNMIYLSAYYYIIYYLSYFNTVRHWLSLVEFEPCVFFPCTVLKYIKYEL